MIQVLTGFAVVIAIIALGFAVGRFRVLGPNAVYTLNMFVFWIALPATLIHFMSNTNVSELFGANLAVVALSTLAAGAIGFIGYRIIAQRGTSDSLVAMLACSYCNGSNLGIPLATHLLDNPSLTLPVILFQVGFYGPISVLLLDLNSGHRSQSLLRDLTLTVVKNPLIIGAGVGITLSLAKSRVGFELPSVAAEPIEIIANATVAVALIAFGMSMAEVRVLQRGHSPRRSVLAASLVKTVVHPAIALGLGLFIFDAHGELLLAMALLAGLPTGQNVFTYAQRFGVNKVLARDTAVISTTMAIPCMAIIMVLLN
ncbi:putative membrane protein [Corynebacterium resistens DSM 45100]|uniref:Membrane protein n=1 Tax=Corynebacterium resistens (strain DSM 45100 / JCM 12819 / GTC 2026 / SICGH 158) TaxID=662755 RepID=F8E0U6_CORRG|nr:AEC family transporter [Corynebacterium resistens]AEI10025.1 putative membrane protein [Corynebacterium resistens DSM 45100]